MDTSTERVPSWSKTGATTSGSKVVAHRTEAEVRAHAAALGFGIDANMAGRIASIYAAGNVLVSIEVASAKGVAVTSPTLRVSDDQDASAASVLPFALTGGASTRTQITAYAFSDTPVTLGHGSFDLTSSSLVWGTPRSNYAEQRASVLEQNGGALWLRESSSHAALFDGASLGDGAVPSLADAYFRRMSLDACTSQASRASGLEGSYGRVCASGSVVRIPDSEGNPSTCTATEGSVPSETVTCHPTASDLALALSGLAPRSAALTRFSGIVGARALGSDVALLPSAEEESMLVSAGTYVTCAPDGSPRPRPAPPARGSAPPAQDESEVYVGASGGCSGDTTSTYEEEDAYSESDSCSSSSTSDDSGRDSSGDDDDDDSGWDDSDDDDSGWDDTDSDDSGWDDGDSSSNDSCAGSSSSARASVKTSGTSTNSKASHLKGTPKKKHKHGTSALAPHRSKNPVSRVALLFVALLLPLRRRGRKPLEGVVFGAKK